jgi:hypothetical protein
MFERKGLAERIDHRSYRVQGIDREPMIHLGYEAAALEKKGIQTERGNHNREVQKRNAERMRESEEKPQKTREAEKTGQIEKELQRIREAQKTMRHIEKPTDPDNESSFVSELEKQLKAEKAMQHIEKMQQLNAKKIAEHMNALKENYFALEAEKILLMETHNAVKRELPSLEYHAEIMDEHVKNIETLQGRTAQLQEARRNLSLLDFKQKKDADEKILQAEQEITKSQDFFKNRFHINAAQAHAEIKRLQEEIRVKKDELATKQILVQAIRKKQEKLELEYHTQKLLNETHPDHQQITRLLEKMNSPPEAIRDKLLYDQINRRLNTLAEEHFQKVIANVSPYEAHILTTIRKQAKERERLIELAKERDRTIERSR